MEKTTLRCILKDIVSRLRKGNTVEATKMIPQMVLALKSVGLTEDREETKNMAYAIRGILETFQKKDFVLMADLIEFELIPLCQEGNG